MVMSHADTRELCNRWFDAYQDRRVDEARALMSEDCIIRLVPYDREHRRDDLLAVTPASYLRSRRRTYDDRCIDTFDGGFVIQYTLNLTEHSGRESHVRVCIVCDCKDGKITRMVEYIDPSKWPFVPEALQKIRDAKARQAKLLDAG